MSRFCRSELLLGLENFSKLKNKHVAVFGVGGVGGMAVEGLARAGIGKITIVDFDCFDVTNINRQIGAVDSTVGKVKVEVFKARLLDINPELEVCELQFKITKDNLNSIVKGFDYVVDAIDDVEAKVALLAYCLNNNIKVVASMGAANHWDPTKIKIADISKTEYCPLAKLVRTKLRYLGIKKGILSVYSCEEVRAKDSRVVLPASNSTKRPEGTISYMPNIFGLFCASIVIRDLAGLPD